MATSKKSKKNKRVYIKKKDAEKIVDAIADQQIADKGIVFPETQEEIDRILHKPVFEVIKKAGS